MTEYETIRHRVRQELARVRQQIEGGDDSELLVWAVPGQLAGAHRPLRYDPVYGGRRPLPPDARGAVERWVDRVIGEEEVRTVFCLATQEELLRYDNLGLRTDGFLAYLRERGLLVCHLPLTDPAHLPLGEGKRWKEVQLLAVQHDAVAMYPEAIRPVLVFCSGGADRSPPVIAYMMTASSG